MNKSPDLTREVRQDSYGPLGSTAYVVVDEAHCLYDPAPASAIRHTPPYGTEVQVVLESGDWVLIRAFGKKAWCPRANLSTSPAPRRVGVDVGVQPSVEGGYWGASLHIEYGPRGGRFVRTASGFKRYL